MLHLREGADLQHFRQQASRSQIQNLVQASFFGVTNVIQDFRKTLTLLEIDETDLLCLFDSVRHQKGALCKAPL